jgi:Ca2+-binding RTX toxin-like protein
MTAKMLCSTFVVLGMLAMAPLELSAQTLGMVADNSTDSVIMFDADTHAVLGTVPITPSPFEAATGDVLITPDQTRGFVTNFDHKVFVIDLTTSPPSLAAGRNPIPISNFGEDISISPGGKFLVVSDGNNVEPISIVDIATQAEISTFSTGSDTNSVDVCSDGSVLATSFDSDTVRRLTLSATGTLTDTGEVVSVSNPVNVYCAPGAASGVVLQLGEGGAVASFAIPGLLPIDTRPLSTGTVISGTINPTGNRVFARSGGIGSIDVFDFNSATGALGASPLLTIPVAEANPFLGIEQIALHPNGGKLFVSEPGALNVYDPNTGAFLASITDPNIVEPTGVTVVTETDPCAGPPPVGGIVGTNGPDILNGTPFGDTMFGLGGSDIINGGGGNDFLCGGAGSDLINGGPDNDTIDAGSGTDTANGDAGNDNIKGDAGSDLITGGTGDDVLDARDGVNGNDSANGGPGSDICTVDAGDGVSSCSP